MPSKMRKIEVHRLTISGLKKGTDYSQFLDSIRHLKTDLGPYVMNQRNRSHALLSARVLKGRLQLRFLSFTEGQRPDILDTSEYQIEPNPLSEDETPLYYTHILGGVVKNSRYLLLVEKAQNGIFPRTVETYINWLIEHHWTRDQSILNSASDAVTASLEAEPSEEFIHRLNNMTRIKRATVRTVRPNPGWGDLDTALGEQAQESEAQKADVTMHAGVRKSLSRSGGIIEAIKSLFRRNKLDYAKLEGKGRQGQKEIFSTETMPQSKFKQIEEDDKGQIVPGDAFNKLSEYMDDLS